jgi:hypothetical protein
MSKFPEKFTILHGGEEFVRARTIEYIEQSDDMLLHLAVCEKAAATILYIAMSTRTMMT